VSRIKRAEKTEENASRGKWMEEFPAKNPNPVIRVKIDGTVLYANRAAAPLLRGWNIETGEKLPEMLINLVKKVSGRERAEELELKVGGRAYMLTFYYEPGEEAVNIYGFDISSRVQREKETKKKHLRLEKALWNNLQIMETMVDTIPAPVYYKDGEGKYLGCNRLFADQIIGLPEEKVIGFKLTELETIIPPATSRKYQQLDMELLRKGGKHVYETVIPYLNGEERDIHVSRAVYRDETENFAILVGVLLDISELKKVEKALRDNLQFQETLLDAIPTPVFYKDMNGNYLGCNELFASRVLGLPKESIVGHSMRDFEDRVPRKFADLYEKYDLKLLRENESQHYEAKVRCAKRGEIRDFLITKALYYDTAGKRAGIVGIMQDITERKKAEEVLQKNEERYQLAAEQTGQIIYDYDIQEDRDDWAGAIEKLTGYSFEEFQKFNIDSWAIHIHPEDRERAVKAHYDAFKTDTPYHEEYRFIRKDGSCFYAEDSGIFLKDRSGRIYRMLGVIKDITERKLSHEQLEQSEERYRTFIENFKGIAYQSGLDFVPVFMHGALEEITGYSEEEFISGKIKWKQIIDPKDLGLLRDKIDEISSAPNFFVEEEYRIRQRSGNRKWVREIVQHIPGNERKPAYLQGTIYDITERKAAEEALEKTQEIRKREIHHRIKNNLQVISSLLELQAEKFDDEKILEAFRESQNRVASMAIIHEELYESKDKDMLTLDFSAYLRKLTADLLQSYTLESDNIRLELDVEEIFIGMDTGIPLGIIINELVSNSLKHAFTPENPGEIRINFRRTVNDENGREKLKNGSIENTNSAESEGQNCFILIVSDNGKGFPEGIDFRNTDSLGLQLVNTLVDQIGGSIELGKGRGTEFSIRFREAEK